MRIGPADTRLYGNASQLESLRQRAGQLEAEMEERRAAVNDSQQSLVEAVSHRDRLQGWRNLAPKVGVGSTAVGITGVSAALQLLEFSSMAGLISLSIGLLGFLAVAASMYVIESNSMREGRLKAEAQVSDCNRELSEAKRAMRLAQGNLIEAHQELAQSEASEARRVAQAVRLSALEVGFAEEGVEVGDFHLNRKIS